MRLDAARIIDAVCNNGISLNDLLPTQTTLITDPRDRALVSELSHGALRWYLELTTVRDALLERPLPRKARIIDTLILVGLYQLRHLNTPHHAAVSSTVAACDKAGAPWAKKLVNAVLRNAIRRQASLDQIVADSPSARHAHPDWFIKAQQSAWPEHWQAILAANNTRAPMTLRVALARTSRGAYLERLATLEIKATPCPHTTTGIILATPVAVDALPGFSDGEISIQDGAAQLAAPLLGARDGERILDACAAPGGKTTHILESARVELTALDADPLRLKLLNENLTRGKLSCTVRAGDATQPRSWWDNQPFDRILVDAPCSGSGVIRRHPDIKILRRASDLQALAARQSEILTALWPLLKVGGRLLYATCSIIPLENAARLRAHLEAHRDARIAEIPLDFGHPQAPGRQILPGTDQMDGFYYAGLEKQ